MSSILSKYKKTGPEILTDPNMTIQDIIGEMSQGVPGAISVLMQMLTHDTSDISSGFFKILKLDSFGIRGSDIWDIYKRECGENIQKFIDVIDEKDTITIAPAEDIDGEDEGISSGMKI